MLSFARRTFNPLLSRIMSTNTLKPRLIAQDLMKKRTLDREKRMHDLNVADIQLVGADCDNFSPSVLVTSGGVSHLFNCSEGMQRYCYANKVKLANLENVFITNFSWDRISGLLGLLLTLQDLGVPQVDIYSSSSFQDYFESTKKFMSFYTGMKCTSHGCSTGTIQKNGITVQPILINPSKVTADLKKAKLNPQLVAYVCRLPNVLGSLDPQKCKDLKVPVGPKLALLKAGQDIELKDGTVVRSSQVCGPPKVGMRFIILECPTLSELDNLVTSPELRASIQPENDPDNQNVELVVHFSPEEVTSKRQYQDWLNVFGDTCKHLFVPTIKNSVPNFVDSYRLLNLLHHFDPQIFPNLHVPREVDERLKLEVGKLIRSAEALLDNTADDIAPELEETSQSFESLPKIIQAASLDKLLLRPRREYVTVEQMIAIELLLKEVMLDPNFEVELNALRESQRELPEPKDYEPELLFLGTGSAIPSKLRNTSNILINFHHPKPASVILDCGEDSHGQLLRHYGAERASQVLKNLRMIYVSHHHADHHIGLIKLLNARKEISNEPVILLLPPNIEDLLHFYNKNFDDLSSSYRVISTRSLKTRSGLSSKDHDSMNEIKKDLLQTLDGLLEDITIVPVVHCSNSCAVVMKFHIGHNELNSFSIAYSGDARPCSDLIEAGRGCDLLIHEATFDFRHQEDAIIKKHCTSTEAIEVSRSMEAKFTILTHFSQRLAKVPYFDKHFDEKIGFSFDHLRLRCPSQLGRLPILKPILSMAFKKSLGEMDLKHMKEQIKSETVSRILESQGLAPRK